MKGKLRELIAWELRDTWPFPMLEIVIAITIIQVMPITSYRGLSPSDYFGHMLFVIVISTAIVFGRSLAESIETRKLVVLLSYPVSRTQVFVTKYLVNLLTIFLIFGSVLFAQGILHLMFMDPVSQVLAYGAEGVSLFLIPWAFLFLYLFLAVFFASSFMTFIAIAIKRFGLSVLIFLIYMFGMEYWLSPTMIAGGIKNPVAHLSLVTGPWGSVDYLIKWFVNWLNIGIRMQQQFTQAHLSVALGYMLGAGLILFLASLFLINKIDLD
jgi:hypothetical protein